MRTTRIADSLFTKTRQKILAATLLHANRSWYVRDLARQLDLQASTLQRDLGRLAQSGILKSWHDGTRVYYQADQACPVFEELRSLIVKTAGVADVLANALKPHKSKIRVAFVFGSIAKGSETTQSDIDLMIVGTVEMMELVQLLTVVTKKLMRQVNPSIYTPQEFSEKAIRSHFIKSVLGKPRLFVIGTENDLEGIISREAHSERAD